MGGKWVRVLNFIVYLSKTSYMGGLFILFVVTKDNKNFSMYRELKRQDDFVNNIVLDYGNC